MKNLIKPFALFLITITLTSCSSDDDTTNEPTSAGRMEFVYDIVTEFTGVTGDNIITLNVGTDAVVIDPTKVYIELNLELSYAATMDYGYAMPSDESEFKYMVGALGGDNQYIPSNTLRFNPNHTNVIEDDYQDGIIPSGDYTSHTLDAIYFPIESPLFNSMLGKNIQGNWKFNFAAYANLPGKVHKIKIIFEEGALELE